MTTKYEVGKLYDPRRTSWSQGGDFNFRSGELELRLFFARLTEADIAAIRSGPATFGYTVVEDLIFFCYEFGQACPISDSNFTIWKVPEAERTHTPLLAAGESAALTIFLVSSETGILRAIRQEFLTPEMSVGLFVDIEAQFTRPYDAAAVDRQLERVYATSSSADLFRRAAWTTSVPGAARGKGVLTIPVQDDGSVVLDMRNEADQDKPGYAVSLGPEGVSLGQAGAKEPRAQRHGEPWLAYYLDRLREEIGQQAISMYHLLDHPGVKPAHLVEFSEMEYQIDRRQLRRAAVYQMAPSASRLLDRVYPGNPSTWLPRDRPLCIIFEEPLLFPRPNDASPIWAVKAIWVRPVSDISLVRQIAQRWPDNPLIRSFVEELSKPPYLTNPPGLDWQVTVLDLQAREYASYEHSEAADPDEWKLTESTACAVGKCQGGEGEPCSECKWISSFWVQILHTITKIIRRDYGVGLVDDEEKAFPEVTVSYEETVTKVVGTGKKNQRKITIKERQELVYQVVTFDATHRPAPAPTPDTDAPEHQGNWITAAKEQAPDLLIWEKRHFEGIRRELDPERSSRWKGERRVIEVAGFDKKVYLLDPERHSHITIRRVVARDAAQKRDETK